MLPAVVVTAAVAAAEPPASAAVQLLPAEWKVLHCGVARGVLYVTYAHQGRAAITPAVANPAVLRACAAAGYPAAASVPQRTGIAPPPERVRPATAALPAPAPSPIRSAPVFTPTTAGSLGISARNDGDIAWQCTLNWQWMDTGGVLRSGSAQAALAPRQSQQIAAVPGAGANARFVGTPTAACTPAP